MADSPASAFSSPPVPAIANRLKAKKRMMTLVNPADPDDFSTNSMLYVDENESPERRSRETTPVLTATITQGTMLTVGDSAVKGILRSAGTPGSGNGVRFFPKNRFRVITPRDEVGGPSTPQKQPAPAPPTSSSFFSQLLSVVPNMSPRRAPPVQILPEAEPDESWERPGEEGEISLVASSVVSAERSTVIGDYEDEEGTEGLSLEVPWTGPAEVHSSPLIIPLEGNSKDISIQDIQAPEISMDRWKARMQGQDDVSNLLSISLPGGDTSFSIGSMAGPSFLPPRPASLSPQPVIEEVSGVSWMKGDQSSLLSVPEEDENPTIRRRLSPIPSPLHQDTLSTSPTEPPPPLPKLISPLPIRQPKAYTSIFADMSAEQAELSWPLARSTATSKSPGPNPRADETTFHSFTSSPAPVSTSPTSEPPIRSTLPRTIPTPGNDTEFFDAATSFFAGTPCPIKPPLSLTSSSAAPLTSLRPSAYAGSLGRNAHLPLGILSNPTRNLFEAHQSHTAAITSELDMYRKLAAQLGKEVEERDQALADMNLRLVENEMRASVAQVSMASSKTKSLSPSPTPSPLAAKSAQVSAGREVETARAEVEGEVRDLEIRLQKALRDGRELREEVDRCRLAESDWEGERAKLEEVVRGMEERERDMRVGQSRVEGQLEARAKEAERQLEAAQQEAESTRRELEETREERRADEEEIQRLNEMLEKAREGRRRADQLRDALQQTEREMEEMKRERVEVERELEGERRANGDMEVMVRELKLALHHAQTSLSQSTSTAQRDISALEQEMARLRTDSSSKDLDILNLQRRKNELKEDREMLNVALDSKQQEVELLKRKLARFSNATPLASSNRHNLDSVPPKHLQSSITIQTPMPSHAFKLHPTTAVPAPSAEGGRRRSSASYATPLQANGRTRRSGALLMPDARTSTTMKERIMRRVPEGMGHGHGENVPPVGERAERRVSRRESVAV